MIEFSRPLNPLNRFNLVRFEFNRFLLIPRLNIVERLLLFNFFLYYFWNESIQSKEIIEIRLFSNDDRLQLCLR